MARLAFPHRLLGSLALGDVETRTSQPHGFSPGIGEELAPGVNIAPATVALPDTVVGVVSAFLSQSFVHLGPDALAVVWVQTLDELLVPGELLGLDVKQPVELL